MLRFDSPEYWRATIWDRYSELARVRPAVRAEFLRQEELTVSGVLQLVNVNNDLRVLDLACGTGRIAELVLRAASSKGTVSMTLIDSNSKTLELAKRNLGGYQNISFLTADAYMIGDCFDGEFDVVICLDFLHHISELSQLFGQIRKVLKPSGLLIANVFAADTYGEWDRLKYGRMKSWRRQVLCSLSESVYAHSPSVVKKLIRRFGLARIEPLDHNQLVASLDGYFSLVEIIKSHYYWFQAKPRIRS